MARTAAEAYVDAVAALWDKALEAAVGKVAPPAMSLFS